MGVDEISTTFPPQSRSGFPELTDLGRRVETLRIERGISKQHLARHADISRQQLWRVMTGKSELTASLRTRLADALGVDADDFAPGRQSPVASSVPKSSTPFSVDPDRYIADPNAIMRTSATMPSGDAGRTIKRELLNTLEDFAIARGVRLGGAFFDLRRRILAGEL
jgi:transcriptional regulator with XRE-family HTH domain